MNFPHLLLGYFTFICLGCHKGSFINYDELLFCTEQFVTITIQIKGLHPSDFYTIRLATMDTLRSDFIYENYYPVVNDNLVKQLQRNQTEAFVFIGLRPENPIFETFEILSDGCHVIKINGADTID